MLLSCARTQLAENGRLERGGYSNTATVKQKNSTLPWTDVKPLEKAAAAGK